MLFYECSTVRLLRTLHFILVNEDSLLDYYYNVFSVSASTYNCISCETDEISQISHKFRKK